MGVSIVSAKGCGLGMNKRKIKNNSIFLGIVIGVFLLVFLTALALGALLSSDLLYRLEVNALHIESESGLSKEIILRNYNAVIDFLNPFNNYSFNMPDLPASAGGVNHFNDVKIIVNAVYIAGAISIVVVLLLSLIFKKRMGSKTLGTVAITVFLVPLIMVGAIAIDFNKFFVIFHELFFTNDDWIFSPYTDPVITILPSEYFMHCAIVIVIFWLLGSVFFLMLSVRKKKKGKNVPAFIPRY